MKLNDLVNMCEQKFVCPKCGGTHFGSSNIEEKFCTRHCHGSDMSNGCGYSWNESDDDKHLFLSYKDIKKYIDRYEPDGVENKWYKNTFKIELEVL